MFFEVLSGSLSSKIQDLFKKICVRAIFGEIMVNFKKLNNIDHGDIWHFSNIGSEICYLWMDTN